MQPPDFRFRRKYNSVSLLDADKGHALEQKNQFPEYLAKRKIHAVV